MASVGRTRNRRKERALVQWTGRADLLALWALRALCHENLYRALRIQGSLHKRDVLQVTGMRASDDVLDIAEGALGEALRQRLRLLERTNDNGGGLRPGEGLDGPMGEALVAVQRNVGWLSGALDLDATELDVLSLATMAFLEPGLDRCMRSYGDLGRVGIRGLCEIVAVMLGLPIDKVTTALRPEGLLVRAMLVDVGFTVRAEDVHLTLAVWLQDVLGSEASGPDELEKRLLNPAPKASLTMGDYPHHREDLAVMAGYLDRVLCDRRRGVNILLWGLAGVGKTECSRMLAEHLDAAAFAVPDVTRRNSPADRQERMYLYILYQHLLRKRGRTIVLFDELEDVFLDALHRLAEEGGAREKAYVNRMLESNPVPTIWLGNRIDQMDSAVLRRFDLVLELRRPPRSIRRNLLQRALSGVPVRGSWLDDVAGDERLVPADITRAATVMEGLAGAKPVNAERTFERIVEGRLRARGMGRRRDQRRGSGDYDLGLVNTSIDLGTLAAGLKRTGRGTVCLSGPPGCGKTAWARLLAEQLDRPLLVRRASDLLSPYVGETESAIAEMFDLAEEDGAVLLLDEADGLLRDRRLARQSWQITQVNEILVGIEEFDGVFVVATNLVDGLDHAVFRRFAAKVRFEPLDAEQRWMMFLRTLEELGDSSGAVASMRHRVDELVGLTPGDFVAARRSAELQGGSSPDQLMIMLGEELQYRSHPGRRVGFGVQVGKVLRDHWSSPLGKRR